ncbi:MAG: alpha-L-fucosidase [Bacteroidetes bacterium]|jgi:alpha-L-fucosidase|nr:alpha-L-fucosidase [Bacteroidota bacterium]MBT3747667.1 alpha-L-fucosidase [Bacteroidota bacterium]MBT4401218.1 alpha-L-fucosidase [Bacteroidota bacterium]MBT4411480.1 alpha-L-fucosidase [Bacteroidota bacterium]MBT5426914.1 alpha-L-fucosidase [Bacteroidota bacterium]
MIKHLIVIFALSSILAGCISESGIEPEAFFPIPNQAQLNWHQAEYIMFAHFGMKTFYPSSDHMGYGQEDPSKFYPVNFDAKQWVEAAKAGGFKGIVITAKHHDGFCNWQTETTGHCVKSSPWKNGQGDIIRELSEACRAGGVYFGIYVSIIDKHFEHAGSPEFDNYGEYYYAQLKELSTQYGVIDEYWFDGYKADELKMDYSKIADLIRETQPTAVVYESGTMSEFLPDRSLAWPGRHGGLGPDQNYRVLINEQLRWYPSEPSIILQGNWFHNNTPLIALDQIQNYYLSSVAYGVTPLMNISPNTDGLIDQETVEGLIEFKAWVDQLHDSDLTQNDRVKVSADNLRGKSRNFSPEMLFDNNHDTYFATDDSVFNAIIDIDLGSVQEIKGFIIQEYIPLGQRIDGYSIACRVDGKWQEVFSGIKIGYKRIILEGKASASEINFPASDAVRLVIHDALACPLISTLKVIGDYR